MSEPLAVILAEAYQKHEQSEKGNFHGFTSLPADAIPEAKGEVQLKQ